MENVKVSIVMLSYNHGKYIEKAIRSAVNQNVNFKYEIIVGDDASPDDSQDEIKKIYNEYPDIIKPVLREKNLGAMKNMIDLLMRVQGEYIAFLEGDDFWTDKNKIQKQVDFLDNHFNFVACSHKNSIVDEKDNIISLKDETHCNHQEYTLEDFKSYILPGQTATLMIRKTAFLNLINNKKKLKKKYIRCIPGDRILALCLLSQGRIYCSKEIMSAYRYVKKEGGTNWTSKYGWSNAKVRRYNIRTFHQISRLGKELGFNIDYREKELNAFMGSLRRVFIKREYEFVFNIVYMLLFSKYRFFLVHSLFKNFTKMFK